MRAFFVELFSIVIILAYLAAGIATLAWFTLLPSIGFLWAIGWLR